MKKLFAVMIASLLVISTSAHADPKSLRAGAAGFVLGAIVAGVATSQPQHDHWSGQPPVGYNPPPPQVIYQQVPSRVVYVVPSQGGYASTVVDMQEQAYWAGYRDAHADQWRGRMYGYGYRPYYH